MVGESIHVKGPIARFFGKTLIKIKSIASESSHRIRKIKCNKMPNDFININNLVWLSAFILQFEFKNSMLEKIINK